MVPKRADELLDGGSLYWVIRGEILCRERILAIRPFVDKDGIGRCRLVLDPQVRAGAAAAVSRLPGLALSRPPRMRRPISTAPAPGAAKHARAAAARAARTRLL